MTTQATPRPWPDLDGAEANARLIARAVNSHDALLAACEAFLAAKPQCDCSDESGCSLAAARKQAREGIALAKAEQTP